MKVHDPYETGFVTVDEFIQFLTICKNNRMAWARNSRCKHIKVNYDMRENRMIVTDRDGKRVTGEDLLRGLDVASLQTESDDAIRKVILDILSSHASGCIDPDAYEDIADDYIKDNHNA